MATNGVNGHHVNGVNGVNGHAKSAHVSVEEFTQQSYDYVICGGGTSGLCIAARLTEDPEVTVGVIEAGKNRLNDPLVDTPAAFLQMIGNPDYDYRFMTTPQTGNRNRRQHLPRGKLLGGSSGINYMMYVRGSESDYDDWAELTGDDGWSSKNMKQYMRKHQTLEPISDAVTDRSTMPFVDANHGTDGPVRTSFNDGKLPIEDIVIAGADHATGFNKRPTDPWSGDHIGFFNTLGLVASTGPNKGKRSYAARGYFEKNQHRPNLRVVTESTVARVILDGHNATGVDFISNGQRHTVRANREVIVCGGAINSPQILELSGIGDPKVLEAAGVDCKVNLPSVGNDLQDHVVTMGTYTLANGGISADTMHKNPDMMAGAQKAYAETQGGPLSWVQSTQGFFPVTMFLEDGELEEIISNIEKMPNDTEFHHKQRQQVIRQLKDTKSANLQFVLISATCNTTDGQEDQARIFPPMPDPNEPAGISFALCMQYPAARGYVHIKSNDPTAHPEIDPKYLSNPADLAVMAAGLKFMEKMANAPGLKESLSGRLFPDSKYDLTKLADRREAVQDWNMGEYHVCGSCAMGSTLDSRLRVNGVRNLRVADASVFPNNVSGNIASSVYMVAERAADIIKEDWQAMPAKARALHTQKDTAQAV